jgi:hypothetical protein
MKLGEAKIEVALFLIGALLVGLLIWLFLWTTAPTLGTFSAPPEAGQSALRLKAR